MKKRVLKLLLMLTFAAFITSAFSVFLKTEYTYAKDIELRGEELGLVVEPQDGCFIDASNLNPGDTITSKITIKNNYKYPFTLSMFTKDPTGSELYKLMNLKVTFDGSEVYNGPIDKFVNKDKNMDALNLGSFAPKSSKELIASVYLPGSEATNEYQGKENQIIWVFSAKSVEEDIGGEEKPDMPKTGEVNPYVFYGMGIIIITLGVMLYRKKK